MYKKGIKKAIDIGSSLVLLIITSPLFLLVAVAIKLFDQGPVFFVQNRVGKHGKMFKLFKFRSMKSVETEEGSGITAGKDSRITKIGNVLRQTKLDELPQLLNVLQGQMSLVGPRPELPSWVGIYPERWAFVLQVDPGITDLASIEFRNEQETLGLATDPNLAYKMDILPRKLDLCERYVKEQSLWLDLKILSKTIVVVIKSNKKGSKTHDCTFDSILKNRDWK